MEKGIKKQSATRIVEEIKRRTRRTFSVDEKIKIVPEGMRDEDTLRKATRDEVTDLRRMNDLLKRELGETYVENKELKKP